MKSNLTYLFFILGSFNFWGQSLQSSPKLDQYPNDFFNFKTQYGSVNASPNPFSDYILIKGIETTYNIKVFDILGNEIFDFTTNEKSAGLSTNFYPKGIYIIELTPLKKGDDSEKLVFKMMKS